MSWFMDLALSKRLERVEGAIGTSFTAVRQELAPEVGATWRDFDGTYAIFDGADSPMTQSFGLGVLGPATPEVVAGIEAFFQSRGAAVMHEVSPHAGVEASALLVDRGYRPIELGTVLVQGIPDPVEPAELPALRVRTMGPADRDAWIDASVAGWSEDPMYASLMRTIAAAACANRAMLHFLVERGDDVIATGSLGVHDGIALLAGASTIPSARGLGAQTMLLAARLAEARRRGCEIAMMVSSPGSTSQRNAERRGFRVAYTRTKWRLDRRGA
jgi:GNAT superfamily N-acetyltransferase